MLQILSQLVVLDLSSIVMGPMAGQTLGDLGADVIKIEPPAGDLARGSGTPGPTGTGALFCNNNRNKRSVVLDLKTPEGRAALDRMVQSADVVLHNFRPAPARRLGVDAERLRGINPRLVHCSTVGFGSDGPEGARPAYDDIIQAAAGLVSLPAEAGGAPAFFPGIIADKVAGLYTVQAILAGLYARERNGTGCTLEVPMFECLVAFLFNEHLDAASFATDGKPGYRRLLTPHRRPHATLDGWLAVMPYSEGHWRRMLAELGRDDLLSAEWFDTPAGRNAHSDLLYEALGKGLRTRSTADWLARLSELDIPCSEISTLASLLDHPQLKAKDFFRPRGGADWRVRSVPQPVRFADAPEMPDREAPERGADMESVLKQFDFSEDEIAGLMPTAPLPS